MVLMTSTLINGKLESSFKDFEEHGEVTPKARLVLVLERNFLPVRYSVLHYEVLNSVDAKSWRT